MGRKPRIVGPAAELDEAQRYCTCCDRPLKGRVAWLELDQRSGRYHDCGDVPEAWSQGWFPFGMTCASRLIAEHCQQAA